MMMFTDPLGMVVVPPAAVVPHMRFIVVAVVCAPLGVCLHPFRMMRVDPARMVVMPPVRIVPRMMVVQVAVVIARMRNRWRSCKQSCQCRRGENCSKFHSWYLLKSDSVRGEIS